MAEDIKVSSIYSELDFRINKKSFSELKRFENRIDSVKKKLVSLKNLQASPASTIASGSVSTRAANIRAGKTPLAQLNESIRNQEAFIGSSLITLENKFRAVKLPTDEIDKAREKFQALGDQFRSGKLIKSEFRRELRALSGDLADMNKQFNKPKPKYSREMNAGWVTQIAKVAKAQAQMERNIAVKQDQFERAARNLGNLKPEQVERYRRTFKRLVDEYKSAPWAVNNFRTQLSRLDRQMRETNGQITFMGSQMARFKTLARGALIPAIAGVGYSIFNAGREMHKTRVLFTTAFGPDAKKELAFLRSESERLGVSFLGTARAYSKIAFSLKLMNIEGSKAKKVFSAFAEASLAFGMSPDDLSRAFKAIEQMYSKGTAQAEELRGQLTEAGIPAVWQIAAKAMGKTSEEFDKAITRREIKSADLIEALADALRELSAPGVAEGKKTIEPTISRFKAAWDTMSDTLYQGFLPAFKGLINIVTDVINAFEKVWDVIAVLGKLIGFLVTGVRMFTALIVDLFTNREKLFKWFAEGMPGLKTPQDFQRERAMQTQTVENKTTIGLTDEAKKLLDVNQEQTIKDFWSRSINSGVTN